MADDIKKFLFKCCCFLPLIGVMVLFPTWVVWRSGELLPDQTLVNLQKDPNAPVLVGNAYSSFRYYKILSMIDRRPKVAVLGSSRTGLFRSKFFKHFDDFYNAGTNVLLIDHFYEFMSRIPQGREPEILIIGLDQRFFHPAWGTKSIDERRFDQFYAPHSPFLVWGRSVNKALTDYFKGKYTVRQVLDKDNGGIKRIGLLGIVTNSGLLNDGSWYFGNFKAERPGYDASFLEQIKTSGEEAAWGDEVSERSVAELHRFLAYCQSRNIYVIGYLTSFPHAVYTQMRSMGTYGYMSKVPEKIKPLFDSFHFPLFNFSDLADTGASDEETIDVQHASEKGLARLTVKLAENDVRLRKYVDVDGLKDRIQRSDNPYFVVGRDEF
jgi:hypothetical protein